jgi:hypothetical protein
MAKTKISEYSATPADNTDISNINIAEGCSPANVNNAIRGLMAQLKDQQDGTSGDPFTVAGTLAVTGALTLDGAAGTSGQVLTSAGSGTPTWSTLGTMAAQNSTTVAITGGTITGITDLTVADGGTGASTITANSVILGNGTSALSGNLVAPSTSGNVLMSNGTTWTSVNKLTLDTAKASTSGTSIDFTGIPTYAKRITVMLNGVSTSGTSNLIFQVGAGSFTTSGYTGASKQTNNANGVNSTTGFSATEAMIAANTYQVYVLITNITDNTWVSSGQAAYGVLTSTGNGSVALGGTLDRVRITTVNGTDTFDAGSINIMYE